MSWNPSQYNRRRVLTRDVQNDREHPPPQDTASLPPPSTLSHPHSLPLMEKPPPVVTTSNGRSDMLGLGLGQGPGPGQRVSGTGRTPLVQELSELESHIVLIKQQLQSAMRRKRELEQLQSETQPANQTASSQPSTLQSNQGSQFAQYTHQQTNQQTNTLPELWSCFAQSNLVRYGTRFRDLLWVMEQDPCLSFGVGELHRVGGRRILR